MTMRMQLHAVGTFPACPHCDDEMRHIVDDRAHDGGHCLSCCCGDSPKFSTFEALLTAMRGWCQAHEVPVPAGVSLPALPSARSQVRRQREQAVHS